MDTGVLRVGVDTAPAPPLCFGPIDSPEFCGFEVDLLEAIAAKLGSVLRCEHIEWSAALAGLQDSRLDMLCRAVTITPGRAGLVSFSDPYLETALALVLRSDSPTQSLDDLIGVRVGVRRATVAEEIVRTKCPAATIHTFEAQPEPYRALTERTVDAIVDHAVMAGYRVRVEPGLRLTGPLEGTVLHYGMVFANGNAARRREVNQALAELRADGTWQGIAVRWLGEGR